MLLIMLQRNVIHNLKCRYEREVPDIYTGMGGIVLVAVNPYQILPVYDQKHIDLYHNYKVRW